MNNKIRKIRARTIWLQTYEALGSISKTARRCGIPHSTLYRWIHRYDKEGKVGLADRSQKPKRLAKQKVNEDLKELILEVRQKYKFGPQRISTFLLREHQIVLLTATIWCTLKQLEVNPLKHYRGYSAYPDRLGHRIF